VSFEAPGQANQDEEGLGSTITIRTLEIRAAAQAHQGDKEHERLVREIKAMRTRRLSWADSLSSQR
jgi:hypothetical protein